MVKGRIPGNIRCVQRTLILEQEVHHGDGTDGCCAMEWKLGPSVLDAGGRFVSDKFAGDAEVIFRGGEMKCGLLR